MNSTSLQLLSGYTSYMGATNRICHDLRKVIVHEKRKAAEISHSLENHAQIGRYIRNNKKYDDHRTSCFVQLWFIHESSVTLICVRVLIPSDMCNMTG